MKIEYPGNGQGMRGEPQLLPLINVVFLLLIFFMLAGALASPQRLSISPPASQAEAAMEQRLGVLSLSADEQMSLDGRALSMDDLAQRITLWKLGNPDQVLMLRADAGVSALRVVELMESLRAQGLPRLQLLTVPVDS